MSSQAQAQDWGCVNAKSPSLLKGRLMVQCREEGVDRDGCRDREAAGSLSVELYFL